MLLRLRYDGPVSNFAYNFTLRRYNMGSLQWLSLEWNLIGSGNGAMVGRCRSMVSRPVLKAPMVSALETIIS
jgi:hypothetical protein